MIKYICIYHKDCLDGLTAAWIVKSKYPDTLLIPANYGDKPPLELIDNDTHVFIVDFSYPSKELKSIEQICNNLIVLDHHESAIRKLESYPLKEHTLLHFDITKSGAILTWEYFHSEHIMPAWIQAVGDRDIWEFKYPYTKEICEYIQSKPLTIEWLDEIHIMDINDIIERGIKLWKPKMDKWLKRIKEDSYRYEILGYNVPIINMHPTEGVSEVLDIMAKDEPFAMSYYHSKDQIIYSFRSAKDQEQSVNVAELAEQLGGGGHKYAAGWRINRI